MSEDFSKNKSEDACFNINFRSQFAKFTAEGNVFIERAPPFKVNSHNKSYLQPHWKDDNEYEQQFNFTSKVAKSEAPIDDLAPKPAEENLLLLTFGEALRKALRFNVRIILKSFDKLFTQRTRQANILIQFWWLLFVLQTKRLGRIVHGRLDLMWKVEALHNLFVMPQSKRKLAGNSWVAASRALSFLSCSDIFSDVLVFA